MYHYKFIFPFLIALLFCSCKNYSPKPKAYNRIDFKDSAYKAVEYPQFALSIPEICKIEDLPSVSARGYWFNIIYPDYNVTLYCSYLPISSVSLKKVLEDSYRLVYSQTLRLANVQEKQYSNPQTQVYGSVFEMGENAPTPIQFFLTDSISHFFRGSLQYNTEINPDSVSPITEHLEKDILHMIESFRWKK